MYNLIKCVHMITQELLHYIKEQMQSGVSKGDIRTSLINGGWEEEDINEGFSSLGQSSSEEIVPEKKGKEKVMSSTISRGLTMNKIIERIIPIIGVIFLTIGFGYLIYTSAWVNFNIEIRLGLGFFFSVVIIGGSYSFSEKLRYFTDLGIGSGVLLLYGTLIYGSRTTDLATAVIPEVVTLFTAFVFTIAVSYFASKRNSKAIIVLGMIGAYITPFVIGQNDVWVQNISFNAYLMYFIAINFSIFLLGREISVRNIIPLNIIGLFVGTTTLYHLSYSAGISKISTESFLTGELYTAILFFALVIFTIWSILWSARQFEEKDDGYLALGYLAPIIWFAYNIGKLETLSNVIEGILYALIATSCFFGWHMLLRLKTRYQHTALYVAGLLSSALAFFALFPELDVYSSMAIAYLSLIFGVIYVLDPSKIERFIGYGILSFMGACLSVIYILDSSVLSYRTLHIVIALLPAMSGYFIAKRGSSRELIALAKYYSFSAFVVALMFVLAEFLEYIELNFLLFYIAPLIILSYIAFFSKYSKDKISHDLKSNLLRVVMVWFAFGFISIFFTLIASIYPAPSDTFIFTHPEKATDWLLIKGVFATIILFVGLSISRRLQSEQTEKRPSFILVIFGFATLLLSGNYIIYALMNDLGVAMANGGPRAIATTIWWVSIAIYMLFVGIKLGERYHSEKLLGLILLGLSVGKIVLYDLSTMGMQNKVIILMVVGGALLLFSYGIESKGWLKDRKE